MAKIRQVYRTWRKTPIRSTYRVISHRAVLAPLIIISLIVIGVLFYYYNRYTQIIDAGLRGDIFVRSSGIYAAPLSLHNGSGLRLGDLVGHLKGLGYLERNTGQTETRGQYIVRGNIVEVFPGSGAGGGSGQTFRNLRVTYDPNGESIKSISDLDGRQPLGRAYLEPELISSVINQEREKRKIIDFKDLPENLVGGIIAIEDRQFFEHPGINWRGILRALVRDYQVGELRQGGSSITQQLVKNFFLKPERTWKRKFAEAYMAIILEQRLSKEEIMAMYCNQIYLGQRGGFSINGFGQAARAYFGKDVSNLSLHESAVLAGIIRSPNYYSPYSNEERAMERRNLVLEKMVEAEKITREEAERAKRLALGVTSKAGGVDASDAPYFVDYLMRQLESQYTDGQTLRSMRVYSTIDLDLQRAAYQSVAKNMGEVEKLLARRRGGTGGLQAALVAMNAKTGEILAMVGGRDYATSQLNRATEAKRQPGSVFKPFVYAAALELGEEGSSAAITPASTFVDEPRTFQFDGKPYEPGNFGDKFENRPMTVRDALVNSKNVITVEIAERIGFNTVQRLAEKAGLLKIPPYPSMALGVGEATPLQMASAYTSFANQGRRVAPISLKRVTTKDGSLLFESKTETREVMSPQVAYIMTSMMEDVLDRGTGTRVRQMGFRGVAAGKTGSSRDGWFAGYTPGIVCVVWVGFDDNSDLRLTGGATAAPIWADFMLRALRLRPELGGDFDEPEEGLVTYDIDPATGAIVQSGSANVRHELFLRGTEPGKQTLPDSSLPDPEPQPATTDPDAPRPAPTPKPPSGEGGLIGGNNDDMIPLPPEARKNRRMTDQTTASTDSGPGLPPAPTGEKPSFFTRLAQAIGFGSSSPSNPEPAPTPWTNSGLKPIRETDLGRPQRGGFGVEDDKTIPVPRAASSKPVVTTKLERVSPPPKPVNSSKSESPKPGSTNLAKATQTSSKSKSTTTAKSASTPKPPPQLIPIPRPTPTLAPTPAQVAITPAAPGSFVLEVCAETGLLPATGVCKSTARRRYTLGREPTTFCSAAKHRR